MTVEMTERLERALELLLQQWDGGCMEPSHVLENAVDAYREAREAPKTGRFEVGQRVLFRRDNEVLTTIEPAWVLYDEVGKTRWVAESQLEPIPAPSEEQGHTIEFQNAEGHTVSVPVEQCFAGADKVVSGSVLEPIPAPSEEQGEGVEPAYGPGERHIWHEERAWCACAKCQQKRQHRRAQRKYNVQTETPITVADEGVRVEPRYETPLTVERLVRVLRKLYAEDDDCLGLADALEAEEE